MPGFAFGTDNAIAGSSRTVSKRAGYGSIGGGGSGYSMIRTPYTRRLLAGRGYVPQRRIAFGSPETRKMVLKTIVLALFSFALTASAHGAFAY
jgi:hypothetical protein